MITDVLALIKTWFDIIRLRKGPDAIPRSPVVFAVSIAMWGVADIAIVVVFKELDAKDLIVGILTSAIGFLCYAAIVNFFGKASRLLQTLTSLIGCSALLTFAFAAGNFILAPFLGARLTGNFLFLILLWSVPVEGHIISRAIDRRFYLGFIFARTVLFLQLYVELLVNPIDTP